MRFAYALLLLALALALVASDATAQSSCPSGGCPVTAPPAAGMRTMPSATIPGWRICIAGPPLHIEGRMGVSFRDRRRGGRFLPPAPPPVPQPMPPAVPADPAGRKSVVKFYISNVMCSSTPILPVRADGRWDILTAAHCWQHGAADPHVLAADGTKYAVDLVVKDDAGDVAWCRTRAAAPKLVGSPLATAAPDPGRVVYHCGYGQDKPGNVEAGTVLGIRTASGQTAFRLSVSHGDSGGGIFDAASGEVVACVSSSTGIAQYTTMFGGSCVAAGRIRPRDESKPVMEVMPRVGIDRRGRIEEK